jgi:hypothetical protein
MGFSSMSVSVSLESDLGMHQSEKPDPDLHPSQKSRIQIPIHTGQISGALEVHNGAIEGPPEYFRGRNGGVEARNVAVESLNPVVSNFQHFDEEQNPEPDPGPHQSANSYPDSLQSQIRIRIKVGSRSASASK